MTARPVAPQIMGVLNVTPDSFSDGGRYADVDAAVAHAVALVEQGASIVDVGGESTRPGATPVEPKAEKRRVIPVVRELVSRGIPVSIDTKHASTALAAVDAGAQIINDVSGGLADGAMARAVADTGVHYVVMHWREGGADAKPEYRNVVAEVRRELKSRIARLVVEGVRPEQIVVDPGLGFGKTAEQNWRLLGHLEQLSSLGHGVLIGASRKRFLAELLPDGAPTSDRDAPTAVISALAAASGAWAVRVHDVASTRLALDVWTRWQSGARP
ncbi:dihydropteroate synthase [Lysinimonas soli]|uniref:Dihydropteroate synthase n=1 Tax=Lysinimonas soli TaxID=1074233 RepID=A0ABW0NQX4_9MICO